MMKAKRIFILLLVIGTTLWISCKGNHKPAGKQATATSALDSTQYKNLTPFTYSIGGKITPQQATHYNLIVVEPSSYDKAQVAKLQSTGATVLGYMSVGEVGPYRWYYKKMKKRGFLGKNKNWNADYLNLADSVTYNLFVDKIIPQIMKKEFDGLFLDTVDDVAPYTDRANLQPYMVKLIHQIKSEYPTKMIVQNDGLFLLNKVHKDIDAVLKEDIATLYDFKSKSYRLRTPQLYQKQVDLVNHYSKKYDMPFLLVDYAVSNSLRHLVQSRLDTIRYPYYIGHIGLGDVATAVTGNNY